MNVIKSGVTATVISQPSRSFDTGLYIDVSVLDEFTKVYNDFSITATYSNGVLSFSKDFSAVEGRFYYVIITQGTEEVVKFKMFCTDQTDLQDYQITEGDFITAPSNSDEIITI